MSEILINTICDMKEMFYKHFNNDFPLMEMYKHNWLFHINKIEEVNKYIKFSQYITSRKPVNIGVFVKEGELRCTKALNSYSIRKNTFFFLPAYQISTHEFMSNDIQGYYLHFHPDLFANFLPQVNIEKEFSFLKLFSYPISKYSGNNYSLYNTYI